MGQEALHRAGIVPEAPGKTRLRTCSVVSNASSPPPTTCRKVKAQHATQQVLSEARWHAGQDGPGPENVSAPFSAGGPSLPPLARGPSHRGPVA